MQIVCRDVRKSYRHSRGEIAVLRGVDLEVAPGEFVALLGSSGSGKSTLLHLIAGLDRIDTGSLQVGGDKIEAYSEDELAHYRRDRVGIVFQFFSLFSSLSVLENVLLPGTIRRDAAHDAEIRARALLAEVGLERYAERRAMELSGGEMQRVAFCRALLGRPALLLADEPTGNLDSENRALVYQLLRQIHRRENTTVLMVTHEPDIANVAERTLCIADGRIVA